MGETEFSALATGRLPESIHGESAEVGVRAMLDSTDKVVIDSFLAENWADFEAHCEQHGVDADEISKKLN